MLNDQNTLNLLIRLVFFPERKALLSDSAKSIFIPSFIIIFKNIFTKTFPTQINFFYFE